MNEDKRDKLAKEHSDAARDNLKRICGISSPQADREAAQDYKGFIAGWNACYAEMMTRREPEEPRG